MSLEFLISKIQKNNFLLIGRAGVDIYPDPPGTKTENANTYVTHLGGSSANMGVQLKKYGGSCSLLTRVSNDALGKFALNQLDHYGVNRDLIKLEDNESRISFAIVESTVVDHQSIIYRHKASDLFLNKNDIDNSNLQNYECILITGTSLAAEPSRSAVLYALKLAKEKNIPVIMDIDYRPYTWESKDKAKEIYNLAGDFCSGIIGNDDEFAVVSGSYHNGLNYAKKLATNCDLVNSDQSIPVVVPLAVKNIILLPASYSVFTFLMTSGNGLASLYFPYVLLHIVPSMSKQYFIDYYPFKCCLRLSAIGFSFSRNSILPSPLAFSISRIPLIND